jgi:hypothetical protein
MALLLGLALGYYWGYASKKSTVTMRVEPLGKVVPHAHSGEHLVFESAPVDFRLGGGLCNEGNSGISTCTVKDGLDGPPIRFFRYSCSICTDPDIPVGSDVILKKPLAAEGVKASNRNPTLVYCDGGTAKADPDPTAGIKGQNVAFGAAGSVGNSVWSVSGLMNACPSDSYSDSTPCTIKNTAPPSTTYTIHIDGCSTNGTGTLTVQP